MVDSRLDKAKDNTKKNCESQCAQKHRRWYKQNVGGKSTGALFAAIADGALDKAFRADLLIAVLTLESGIATGMPTWLQFV